MTTDFTETPLRIVGTGHHGHSDDYWKVTSGHRTLMCPVNVLSGKGRKNEMLDNNTEGNNPFDTWLFPLIFMIMMIAGIGIGMIARRVPPVQQTIRKTNDGIRTEFNLVQERPLIVPPKQDVVREEQSREEQPVDLTEKPKVPAPEETPPLEPPQAAPRPVRKVFGIRRVYSTGLGSGGTMSDAVIGKLGNTINKAFDTIVATESDMKGTVVSTATVTSVPRFRKIVKPEYTREMVERKIEGTVKVKVLIDIDGRVKKATCLNDIGFDSASEAVKATLAMEFEPAMRGSQPVAVWIVIPIKFVLLG